MKYSPTYINLIFLTSLFCILFFPAFSQEKTTPVEAYNESPDDPYIYVPRQDYQTAAPYFFSNTQVTTRQVNVNEQGQNMLGDAANEPSLAVDPINPDRMAMGWRQFDTISSNFRQAGFGYTLDGGENWAFPGPIEPGIFRSDPVLDFDVNGTFYYNSLTTDYFCQVFKSVDDISWDAGTSAKGGDKQWMVVDRTGGEGEGNIYAFWKPFITSCSGAFTRSVDAGSSYEECSDMPNNSTRGTMAIGPDGELYACGETSGNFYVAKSSNAVNADEAINWDLSTMVDMGGALSLYQGPNPNGMLGQVWVAADNSDGSYRGQVYLLATVDGFSLGDHADIVFSKSSDGGETWSDPIKINDDAEDNYNWFATISVAPNGRIDVAWVDTRDEPGTYLSALYYSNSFDGGETWSLNEKLSESFDPHLGFPSQNKIGDYYHMISDEEGAHLAWAATFNGEQDVYYSYILPEPVTHVFDQNNPVFEIIDVAQNSPNPFNDFTKIKYSLKINAPIKIEILDLLGNVVETIVDKNKLPGEYAAIWNAKNNSFHSGAYFAKITVGEYVPILQKMIFIE